MRLKPFLLLAVLTGVYFHPLFLHPTQVLYADHSDLLATFLPTKHFLVRFWQETGELPLWSPYSFGGMPLIHDVQATAFYPCHLPLYLLPEAWLGAAMSWLVVLHVLLAGSSMYVYARSQGLEPVPALVAGVGYMFAGKWLLHILAAGHYVLIPLAWLPFVLLGLERAFERRSFSQATGAGVAFAFIVLGTHPQLTFYAGLFVVLWTAQRARPLGSWLLLGGWAALVAVALSAVQLLPALEAAPHSTRAVGVPMSEAAAVAWPALLGLVGPSGNGSWEERGGLGLLWVAAAIAAAVRGGGRVRYQAGVGLALLFFATGGAVLVQGLPGFRLFQLPVRMLLLLAFPIALLAGHATQGLGGTCVASMSTRQCCRRALLGVMLGGLMLAVLSALRPPISVPNVPTVIAWGVLLAIAGAGCWCLRAGCSLAPEAWLRLWFVLLLADTWAVTWGNVAVRPEAELYAPSACVRFLADAQAQGANERWRVLDRGLSGSPSSAPLGAALPLLKGVAIEPVLGYNPFDLRSYKEYLQFIMDEERPIRPRQGIFGYPIVQAFPIRKKALLDLLGTRYLLEPSAAAPRFDAAGEAGRNSSWRPIGEVDAEPRVYSFLAGGMQTLPPYRIFENAEAFPRAFVVHEAASLAPAGQVLAQLKSTDFHRTVLLEGMPEDAPFDSSVPAPASSRALLRSALPNRVIVDVQAQAPGYLVLTDLWFPGWRCTVDEQPVPLYRANFLFRAVAVERGEHQVVFTFDPASYRWGKRISLAAWIGVVGLCGWASLSRKQHRGAVSAL